MALTKKQRDAMPDSDFAVPETKDLPIPDKIHVGMAWRMVDQTKGLSDEQRKTARERILNKAKELGMDTKDWEGMSAAPDANDPYPDQGDLNEINSEIDKQVDYSDKEKLRHEMEKQQEEHENAEQIARIHGMTLSAMAMEFPEALADHPNQTPFKGVLTRLNEPSDNPLSGSNGKRVILPTDVAEKGLASLIGMGVDFTPNFDGHDVKSKIGLITEANIKGNEIEISGFFYGADYESEVKRIQAEKSQMGFSFEAQAKVRSMNDDPLIIVSCVFTGAAVLYKDKAAYTTTSLSAKKMEKDEMTPELKKLLDDMQAKIDGLTSDLAASKEREEKQKLAAGNIQGLVAPHANALRACASGMAAAGIGMHAKAGHVSVLNGMADQMEADAVLGKMPHIYQGPDFYSAAADKKEKFEASSELNEQLKKVTESLEEVQSKLVDAEKARFAAAAEPERKTLSPSILKLLSKAGIKSDESAGKMKISEIDEQLKASGMSLRDRMSVKLSMQEAGKLAS